MESSAIDPGVINEKMLRVAIEEQGYRGEAQRLSQLEPINYAKITSIRLEFLSMQNFLLAPLKSLAISPSYSLNIQIKPHLNLNPKASGISSRYNRAIHF